MDKQTQSQQFHHVGIICRPDDPSILPTLNSLCRLITAQQCDYTLEAQNLADQLPGSVPVMTREQIGRQCDLIIVIGGDGTLLDTGRAMSQYNIPVLGVNLGRLGFLVDVSPAEMAQKIPEILAGHYIEEARTLLRADISHNGDPLFSGKALNDIVVHKINVARMIEFDVYINSRFVYTQRSDGLVIATPTGSTAYALSGGGPILHPTLDAITLVPICPHTLTNRPIAIGTDSVIEIRETAKRAGHGPATGIQISCDGQLHHQAKAFEKIMVRVIDEKLRLIHPQDYDYYQLLRAKLNWATQHYPQQEG